MQWVNVGNAVCQISMFLRRVFTFHVLRQYFASNTSESENRADQTVSIMAGEPISRGSTTELLPECHSMTLSLQTVWRGHYASTT